MLIPENLEQTVRNLKENDPKIQLLLEKSYLLSVEYFRVLESLDPADRACIQQYHDLCEDLEDRIVGLVAAHYATHGTSMLVNTQLQ